MKRSFLGGVAALGCLLLSTQASALGANTTVNMRCYYRSSAASTAPSASYKWALASGSSSTRYAVAGNWFKDGITAVANMFYTTVSQATLVSACNATLARNGITQPLMKITAAQYFPGSHDYTFWTQDSASQPTKINKLVVFGDSVSDNGNLYFASNGVAPNGSSWFLGHFTNGKVWDEYLSDNLGLPNYNWAVGGAAGDPSNYGLLPGVVDQVNSYLDYMTAATNYRPANTLFTMLMGANDIISYGRSAQTALTAEQTALDKLIASGARNILVGNLPDLTRAPEFRYFRTDAASMGTQINAFNAGLPGVLSTLRTKYGSSLNIQLIDFNSKVADMLARPSAYGVTNTTDACLDLTSSGTSNYATSHSVRSTTNAYGKPCTNADTFLFWDNLHPTTNSHKVIGQYAFDFVKNPANKFPL